MNTPGLILAYPVTGPSLVVLTGEFEIDGVAAVQWPGIELRRHHIEVQFVQGWHMIGLCCQC